MIEFYSNRLGLPRDVMEEYKIISDECKADDIYFRDLTKVGQQSFERYKLFYITVKNYDEQQIQVLFKRLNYSLAQTLGEKLHSIASPLAKRIDLLLKDFGDRVDSHYDSSRRHKLFEKLAIVLLIKTNPNTERCDQVELENFITKSPNVDESHFIAIRKVFCQNTKIYERHLIPLLLCENPTTPMYSLLYSHKSFFNKFNANFHASCKSIFSVNKNIELFNGLCALETFADEYKKYVVFAIIQNLYLDQCPNKTTSSGLCDVCHLPNRTRYEGKDGGILNWQLPIINVCSRCKNYLPFLTSDQIRLRRQ